MKLAVSQIAWPEEMDEVVASALRSLGVEAVELVPKRVSDPLFWRAKGFSVVAMQALLYGTSGLALFQGEKERALLLEHLRQVIDLASSLEARVLVFGSPGNRRREEQLWSAVWPLAVDFFAAVADYAQQKNCVFCVEANPRQYSCDFITETSQVLHLVEEVNSPGLGIHFDTGGMALNGENFKELLERAGNKLQHVHLSAPHLVPIYQSQVPFAKLLSELRRVGYDKAISIEMKGVSAEETVLAEETVEHLALAVRFVEERLKG